MPIAFALALRLQYAKKKKNAVMHYRYFLQASASPFFRLSAENLVILHEEKV